MHNLIKHFYYVAVSEWIMKLSSKQFYAGSIPVSDTIFYFDKYVNGWMAEFLVKAPDY